MVRHRTDSEAGSIRSHRTLSRMAKGDSLAPSFGLVLVRLAVGGIFLQAGWHKIVGGVGPELVEDTAERIAAAPAFFAWWGEHVVLRFPAVFAELIRWGECLIGVAFVLGALVRPAGVAALFMLANFYLAGPPTSGHLVLLLAVCALACALSRAGRRFGLDAILDQHFPVWATWSRA